MTNFEIDLIRFNEFISKETFINAKTYEKTAPHEYIVCKIDDSDPQRRSEFEWLVLFIRRNGYPKKFWSKEYTYFDYEGYSYWTMGDPLETTWILNRAIKNDPRCKDRGGANEM